jgi:hypothetical protein
MHLVEGARKNKKQPRIKKMLTKQHEIDMLQRFVASLPEEGYLKSMFTPIMVEHIVNQIRNDLGFIDHTCLGIFGKYDR